LIITEQQFFDYIHCPALFEMTYIKKIPMEESTSFPKLLEKVAKYFYLHLLNGRIASASELKKKWDSICQANEDKIDNKKVMEGIGLIFKLLNWADREQPVVLDIDTRYNIHVGNVELVGNMETILAAPNKKYELLITSFSSRLPDQMMIDMKMKYTLEAYAFNKVYNKPVDGIRVYSVKHAKDFYTYRTDDDFKRLETAIKSVGESIEKGLYYPREGIMCSSCPAKGYCRYWSC